MAELVPVSDRRELQAPVAAGWALMAVPAKWLRALYPWVAALMVWPGTAALLWFGWPGVFPPLRLAAVLVVALPTLTAVVALVDGSRAGCSADGCHSARLRSHRKPLELVVTRSPADSP